MKTEELEIQQDPHEREIGLANGEVVPKNRLENQIRLATAMYRLLKDENVDLKIKDNRNNIMFFWSEGGDESFSKTYHYIENDSNFMLHPRLQGNILNISVDDVIFYKQNKQLPLE